MNQLAGALFSIHGPGDVHDRLQEFLAVSLVFLQFLNLSIFFPVLKYMYSQTCIKRSPLGDRKSGLLRQVTS